MTLEANLTLNVSSVGGAVCRKKLMGKSYLVANMSMIVPGVLPGSRGKLLYTREEINKNVIAWNGVPITNNHPIENGTPVSARSPEILEKYSIGVVLNAKGGDKLTAEGWFDEERTKEVCPEVHAKLVANEKIELSTGLSADVVPVVNGVTPTGEIYDGVISNFRPDHLAVLPVNKGACSLEAGCGVNNSSSSQEGSSESLSLMIWNKIKSFFVKNELSHDNIRTELRKLLTERFVSTTQDKESYNFLWVVDVFAKYVVYSLEDKYWKVGYSVKGNSVTLSTDEPTEVTQVTRYEGVENSGNEGDSSMTKAEREALISNVLGECGCKDREVLNGLSDEALKKLAGSTGAGKEVPAQVNNSVTSQTPSEPKLPAEILDVVNYVKGLQNRERDLIVNKIVAHIPEGEARTKAAEGYKVMSVEQLTIIANSLSGTAKSGTDNSLAERLKKPTDFSGASADVNNATTGGTEETKKEENLVVPVMNYSSDK